ncbi:AAA domain [Chelatococcus sambhunathii]|uniref:AAA domain n=1 Tax=Chelatococcus sambhunathii TaxID=363953 RepID=A0ABM9U9L9_9HYPH|nr:AAA family ATPase [Chelatococcus sambhunathii]CUA90868.1 AAA domain [Chelatococcus sambhunathii]
MMDLPPLVAFADWEPEAARFLTPEFRSRFGAVFWGDLDKTGDEYEMLVDGMVTKGERSLIVGASQTGKSFWAITLGMAVARGVPFFGRRVERGLVIYIAAESARGVRKRLKAYRQYHGIPADEAIPFVVLTKPVDLFRNDDDMVALIDEVRAIAAMFDLPLALIVIDTLSAVAPGWNENTSEDVSRLLRRAQQMVLSTGGAVTIVHHKNSVGNKPRGHTSIFADVENVIDIDHVTTEGHKGQPGQIVKDAQGRKIKRALVTKQKDGEDGLEWRFVLRQVEIGRNKYDEPITSCVVEAPDMGALEGVDARSPDRGPRLSDQAEMFRRAIEDALDSHGIMPPAGVPLPNSIRVVEYKHVRDRFAATWFGDEGDEEKRAAAVRQALKRHGEALMRRGIIGKAGNYVWLTGKRLAGEPAPEPMASAPAVPTAYDDDLPFV